jgi:hypothetical protein
MFSISNILDEQQIISRREAADASEIDRIANMDPEDMRAKLMTWATTGFPAGYPILEITLHQPLQCLDGVARSMIEYVPYLTNKTVEQHLALLQAKFIDITAGVTYTTNTIRIHVSRNLAPTPM